MAKNAKTAAKASTKASAPADKAKRVYDKPFSEAKRDAVAKFREEYKALLWHFATTIKPVNRYGEEVIPAGATVEVIDITTMGSRLGVASAIVLHGGERKFAAPANLKAGKPMPAARKAVIEAEREAERSETVLVPGTAVRQSDTGTVVRYAGWMKNVFFPTSMITKREGTMPHAIGSQTVELDIFEVPAWKVRSEVGEDALTALQGKQAAITGHLSDE